MERILHPTTSRPQDLDDYIHHLKRNFGGVFAPKRNISIARAPARLDVMGGIASYSGAVILEATRKEATIVGVQRRHDRRILIRSHGVASFGYSSIIDFHLDDFYENGELVPYDRLHERLTRHSATRWGAYVLGAFAVLLREGLIKDFPNGANIGILGNIPFEAGLGSSASLEVATVCALTHAFEVHLDSFQIARACQMIENHIIEKAEGIMDQVVSLMGKQNQLLALRCQPHEIVKMIDLPKDVQVVGFHSGAKNPGAEQKYKEVRAATFMGRKILFSQLQTQPGLLPYSGYLCNISTEEWGNRLRKIVPARMKGEEFLAKFKTHDDDATRVDPDRWYKPKSAVEYPIRENDRVFRFMGLIENYRETFDEAHLRAAGQVMFESHHSLQRVCGLSSRPIDLVVEMVRELGPDSGLYGARLSGESSGGTVAILCHRGADETIRNLAARFTDATGFEPYLLFGSSPGALEIPIQVVRFE